MDLATDIAREIGCRVYVTGSVYLVGKLIKELLYRTDGDIWDYLTIHPSRVTTEV